MAPTKPVITVVGSTSKQGYSVAKSLLETGIYTVRALTRSAGGECAPLTHAVLILLITSSRRAPATHRRPHGSR